MKKQEKRWCIREEAIKMYLGEIVCENVDWLNLAPVKNKIPMVGSCDVIRLNV